MLSQEICSYAFPNMLHRWWNNTKYTDRSRNQWEEAQIPIFHLKRPASFCVRGDCCLSLWNLTFASLDALLRVYALLLWTPCLHFFSSLYPLLRLKKIDTAASAYQKSLHNAWNQPHLPANLSSVLCILTQKFLCE